MTLAQTARAATVPGFAVQAIGLSLIMAASAHVSVPFWPVPMTLQTFAVLAIAGVCGARLGFAAMLAYLAQGAMGLPVFATGAGPGVLVGPTAGYLFGMLAATLIVGQARGPVSRAACIVLATLVIYFAGVTWLATFVGLEKAFTVGVLPFLAGDAVKGALAWALAAASRRRV
jgi:biotin transport system substrate-specific component